MSKPFCHSTYNATTLEWKELVSSVESVIVENTPKRTPTQQINDDLHEMGMFSFTGLFSQSEVPFYSHKKPFFYFYSFLTIN